MVGYNKGLTWGVLSVALVITLFPIYWMLATSVTPYSAMFNPVPTLMPPSVSMEHYVDLLRNTPFLTFTKNSVIVSTVSMLLSVFTSTLAAYAITRLRLRGRHALATLVMATYLLPQSMLFIPMYILVSSLKLANTLPGLILTYPTFLVPYGTWMLMSYFKTIPREIEEAALIDGCSRWQTLWRIIAPLAAPGISVVAIFSFTLAWDEFLYALVVTTSPSVQTLPVGIAGFIVGDIFLWGRIMSASVLTALPMVLLYTVVQRWVVYGMTAGSVKG